MAFMQRFLGRASFKSISVARGGFQDAASGVAGSLQGVVKIPIQAVAALTTDFSAAIPPGATILSIAYVPITAFTGNTATLMLGSSAGDNSYVAAADVKAASNVLNMTMVGSANLLSMPALVSGKNIFARLTQTATTTAVGTGTLVIEYV